jgi:hypothetical protein
MHKKKEKEKEVNLKKEVAKLYEKAMQAEKEVMKIKTER